MVEKAEVDGKKNIKLLEYPDTGHLIDLPHSPFINATGHPLAPKDIKIYYGGILQPHALAQIHAWTETLQFYRNNL